MRIAACSRLGLANSNRVPAGGLKLPEQPDRDRADDQRDDQRRRHPRKPRQSGQARGTARSSTAAIQKPSRNACTRSMPKRRNTPATIAITIGIGIASITRRTSPVKTEHQHQAGRSPRNAPITSGKAEMRERWPDQHRARNGPEEHQRLPVEQRKDNGDQPIEKKRSEYPGRKIGFATARRAHRPTG